MAKIIGFPDKGSDQRGFEQLLQPHVDHLYRLAYRFAGNKPDAEDLVQDLMIKIYPRRKELDQVENLRPWLVRVMYNLFIDGKRRQSRSPIHLTVDNTPDHEGSDPLDYLESEHRGPEEETARHLYNGHMVRTFDQLSNDHRMVITLHDIEGYTLEEMTAILDCPIGTLKSRLHRARARFRDLLKTSLSEPHCD